MKFGAKEHIDQLIIILTERSEIADKQEKKKYSGIILDWDYDQHKVYLSISSFSKDAQDRFNHALKK